MVSYITWLDKNSAKHDDKYDEVGSEHSVTMTILEAPPLSVDINYGAHTGHNNK